MSCHIYVRFSGSKLLSCLLLMLFVFTEFAYSQDEIILINKNVNPGEVLDEKPLEKGATRGHRFLLADHTKADIFLTSGKPISGYRVNYDIFKGLLEIKTENQIKILSSEKVDSFSIFVDRNGSVEKLLFYNVRLFAPEFQNFSGFFEVLYPGEFAFLKNYKVEFRESDYAPTVGMGKNFDRFVKSTELYIYKEGTLHKFPKTRKKVLRLFQDSGIENFIETNDLDIKQEADVITILKFAGSRN